MNLSSKQCVPCRGGISPLKGTQLHQLCDQLDHGWEIIDAHHLTKSFKFKDFTAALACVNRIGEMADEQAHHPDIYLAWGKVRVEVWTHKIDGLTESDFIFAAKAEQLVQSHEPSQNN
ncbi:MAG: 4a-hydroxytetrahydrobiopterin dehydratase [Gammaproteobacteria bacterium]|nr:4a-hydroxytetrahydrobiopterin dehydratase [Gammaproteobacteria bacterium]